MLDFHLICLIWIFAFFLSSHNFLYHCTYRWMQHNMALGRRLESVHQTMITCSPLCHSWLYTLPSMAVWSIHNFCLQTWSYKFVVSSTHKTWCSSWNTVQNVHNKYEALIEGSLSDPMQWSLVLPLHQNVCLYTRYDIILQEILL